MIFQTVEKGKEGKETSEKKLAVAKPCIFAQQSAGHAANAAKKGVATAPAGAYRSGAKPPLRTTALKARLLARRRPFFI